MCQTIFSLIFNKKKKKKTCICLARIKFEINIHFINWKGNHLLTAALVCGLTWYSCSSSLFIGLSLSYISFTVAPHHSNFLCLPSITLHPFSFESLLFSSLFPIYLYVYIPTVPQISPWSCFMQPKTALFFYCCVWFCTCVNRQLDNKCANVLVDWQLSCGCQVHIHCQSCFCIQALSANFAAQQSLIAHIAKQKRKAFESWSTASGWLHYVPLKFYSFHIHIIRGGSVGW